MLEFRTLNESEIDVRVATAKKNGLCLLLYKDARVDQNILDETVGPLDWQREPLEIKGVLYCKVSLWDKEKSQWVSKSDCGVESYSEKEKGESSDSFKRACFNWGIGRELYTAPFTWVTSDRCNITTSTYQGKEKYSCHDKFVVEKIKYDDKKNIIALSIINTSKKDPKGKPIRAFLLKPPVEEKGA